MSRAFVKEGTGELDPLPDLPVSAHPNHVTPRGLEDHRVALDQPALVALLRDAGCSVQCLHSVGQGCPDLVVGVRGVNYMLEVKAPASRTTSTSRSM